MPTTIRVATFNLRNLGLPDGPDPRTDPVEWQRTLDDHDAHVLALRRVLTRLRADVLAVQEVMSHDELRSLLSATAYASYQSTPFDTSPDVERQQVIVSRFPIHGFRLHEQQTTVLWVHSNAGDPVPVRWNRPIVEASIDLPGIGRTAFLALHLKSKRPSDVQGVRMTEDQGWPSLASHAEGGTLSALKRVGQALEVRRLADGLFARHNNARIVVLGDFNDSTDSVPVSIVRGDYVGARNPRLWDQELFAVELSLPQEKQFTFVHRGAPMMIDHILISRALLPCFGSATVLNETTRDHHSAVPPDRYFPDSDHAPVVAEFWAGE